MPVSYGATPEDWTTLARVLAEDLLPVVSNPHAAISPRSSLKTLGKVPSLYNGSRQGSGIPDWTNRRSGPKGIARWMAEPDYGICIQTRHVRALDIDIDDPATAQEVTDLILGVHPELHFAKRSRTGSGKCLFAFRLEGDFYKRAFPTEGGLVEFLATGQQFVAVGTHPSGSRYEWPEGLPEEFPTLTAAEFEALWALLVGVFARGDVLAATPSVRVEKLDDAVQADPIAAHLAKDGWVLSTSRDGGLNIRCPWEGEHTSPHVDTATRYFPAHTGGYEQGHFKCLHAHCASRTDSEFQDAIGARVNLFDDLTGETGDTGGATPQTPSQATHGRFDAVQAADFAAASAPAWIIKDVVPDAQLVVLFGAPGSGKSFMAIDLAMSIARGEPWRGHRVAQGSVAYIAAEGTGGLRRRLAAYGTGHDVDLRSTPLHVIPAAPNLMEEKDAVEIAHVVQRLGARVLFVDTVAQVTSGGDENSSKDMGKMLKNCREIHRVTGCVVVLIHHSGKDSSKGARGWSGLLGAADAELEVCAADNAREMTITKQKDGGEMSTFPFTLQSVELGRDEDGEPITSCIVAHHNSRVAVRSRKVSPVGRQVLEYLTGLPDAVDGVAPNDIATALEPSIPTMDGVKDNRRNEVLAVIKVLQGSGHLICDNGKIFLVEGVDST